jgi:hypothetical protein
MDSSTSPTSNPVTTAVTSVKMSNWAAETVAETLVVPPDLANPKPLHQPHLLLFPVAAVFVLHEAIVAVVNVKTVDPLPLLLPPIRLSVDTASCPWIIQPQQARKSSKIS